MNEFAQSVSRLYAADRSPVVGVCGGEILFCNMAAMNLFRDMEPGKRASKILPEAFLNCDEESFCAVARVDNHAISANGVRYNGMLLLRMELAPSVYEFSTESFVSGMRTELATQRIALEQIEKDLSEGLSSRHEASLAVLRRSYYRLLRQCENTALADALTSRSAVFEPLQTDPAEWLSDMVELMKDLVEIRGVELRFRRPADFGTIPVDRNLLEQTLLNLISNSLSVLQPGGTITLRLSRPSRSVLLTVDDSGPGFSEEVLGGFYRRSVLSQQQGMCRKQQLGLLIACGVADLHGGSVTITNRRIGGASVRVALPAERVGHYTLRTPTEPYRARYPKNEHVLIALSDVLPEACYSLSAD